MRRFLRFAVVLSAMSMAIGPAHFTPSALAKGKTGVANLSYTKTASAVTCNISCDGPQQPVSVLLEDSFECCWACVNYCNQTCTVNDSSGSMTCG
jgi:hypothetical protein